MTAHILISERARALGYALLLVTLVMAGSACTQYVVLQLGPGEPSPELSFKEVQERDSERLEAERGGVRLHVYHAPHELELARTALAAATSSVEFLADALGTVPEVSVDLYLYPWDDDERLPSYQARGADYVGIVFYRDPDDLLASLAARRTLRAALVHKVAIRRLLSLPAFDPAQDRWLFEGLPEALVYRYTEKVDPEVWLEETARHPPRPLAASMDLRAWNQDNLVALIKAAEDGDRRLAYYLGFEETRMLAAAQGLAVRWLEAIESGGQDHTATQPSRDLLSLLRQQRRSLDWGTTRELALRQTGRTPEELVRPDAAALAHWRATAWTERSHQDFNRRLKALRTLELVGLPEDAQLSLGEVEPIFEADELAEPRLRYALWQAAAGVVAEARDPDLAAWAIDRLSADDSDYRFSYRTLPSLWQVRATVDRDVSLEMLSQLLLDDRYSLVAQEEAARALRALTGRELGWRATMSPDERDRRADRWREIVTDSTGPPVHAGDE